MDTNKKRLIENILIEQNENLFLFLMMQLLKNYPEFREKIIKEWDMDIHVFDTQNIYMQDDKIYSKYLYDEDEDEDDNNVYKSRHFNYVYNGVGDHRVKRVLKKELENEF
jgi:hypothetical protein